MQKNRYRKLLSEEIIENSKRPEIVAPIINYRGDRGGDDLLFDWSCISKPFVLEDVPRHNGRDQFILFSGTNLDDLSDFQAEIEISLDDGGYKKTITEPMLVYIPTGLTYGPIHFKQINKPVVYMNFYIGREFSKKWAKSEYEKYFKMPSIRSGVYETRTFNDGNPFRVQKMNTHMMLVLGNDLGEEGANFCVFYYVIKQQHLLTEPTHAHDISMWIINLGGDPMNVEDFDAEMEMWWGEENEKVVIDTPSVAHITPGLLHRSIFYSRVKKPFIQIHTYTSDFCDKDEVVAEDGGMNMAEGVTN